MKHIYFGEAVPGYKEPVLNEREVRAAAGILFLFAIISFLNAWLAGNFQPIKAFVTFFMLDFMVRVLVNPKYSPSLLLGRVIVRRQTVEYVGAAQKRVAWALGLTLSVLMFGLVVVGQVIGPANLFLCLFCLTLLFFESALGICLGCKLYPVLTGKKAEACPGGACKAREREPIQRMSSLQLFILSFSSIMVIGGSMAYLLLPPESLPLADVTVAPAAEDCKVPEWAKAIGHEELYLLHHGCASK